MSAQALAVKNEETMAALVNLIVCVTDNKYFLGRRVSEWCTGAPTLEAGVACAAIAQEELGTVRAIQPLLNELSWRRAPKPLEREGDRERKYCVSFLDKPYATWAEMVAAMALVDTATTTLLAHLVNSRYEPLARRAARAVEAERFHLGFVEGQVRDLVVGPGGRERLKEAVEKNLAEVLCWFGPPGEPGVTALREEGLLTGSNEELRQAFLQRLVPLLLEGGVEVPVQWNVAEQRWEYGNLPWNRWNSLQRRF